jgi:nitroreductase
VDLTAADVRTVVRAATLAPSVHNSQPWRFAAHDDGLDVFADRARQLDVIDPTGRELHISCGAAISFAAVAIRALDRACSVSLLPDPANPDHLAHIRVGASEPATEAERALAAALPRRYTERDRFEETPVPAGLLHQLGQVAADVGAWTKVLTDADDLTTAAVLLARADDLEQADPDYKRELATWTRADDQSVDGIPRRAVPPTPVGARGSSLRLRDFDIGPHTDLVPMDEPPPAEHPVVLVLGTDADDPLGWLQAGQGLGRVLLAAAAAGVSATPLTQVLEVPATRLMLTRDLHLRGYPQMLLRLGYGRGHPTTGRRPVDAVLDR